MRKGTPRHPLRLYTDSDRDGTVLVAERIEEREPEGTTTAWTCGPRLSRP
ncbi:hypothetical protein [Halorubrum ezzemoulense]